MSRPKKAKEFTHKNAITLKLTDVELDYLTQAARSLNITRVEYLRNLISEKPMIYKYEIVANDAELRKLTGEIGKIGSNLNQIAHHLNSGGIRSREIQDEVQECISELFDLRKQILKIAGENYGDIKTQDK